MNERKVPSLKKLASQKIAQNAHQLTNFDFGLVPLHLVLPTLARMNAKQLSQVEETNPGFTPDSDKLWRTLLEKDFPQRPSKPPKTFTSMPYKTLHRQYTEDRDSLREDSTQKLRKRIEKIQQRRSANQIVQVEEMLRDPTVKPSYSGYSGAGRGLPRVARGKPTTILEKVRKDLDNRKTMFPSRMRQYESMRGVPKVTFTGVKSKKHASPEKVTERTPALRSTTPPKAQPEYSRYYSSLVSAARREEDASVIKKRRSQNGLFVANYPDANGTTSLKDTTSTDIKNEQTVQGHLQNLPTSPSTTAMKIEVLNSSTNRSVPNPKTATKESDSKLTPALPLESTASQSSPIYYPGGVPLAPELRKKLQASMFLKRKPPPPLKRKRSQPVEPEAAPSKIKRIKSSVFS